MAKVTITSLAIANFGPYREEQVLDLHVQDKRPVILVKALNGSGKTTLLTALQIGLYGQRAIPSGRKSEYENLVRDLMRSDAAGAHYVEVGLSFDSATPQEYVLRREWTPKSDGVTEVVTVLTNGAKDSDLSATWDEFIEGILPAELIQLFFFDGERIEALANPEKLPDLLRRATEVFLGIGGIDALSNDLKAVERRKAIKNRGESPEFDEARLQLEALETHVALLASNITVMRQEKASLVNAVDQSRIALDRFKRKAQRKGAEAYASAAEIRSKVAEAEANVKLERKGLTDLMSDPLLPMLWLGGLWRRYQNAWDEEVQIRQARHLAVEFKKRDHRLLKHLGARTPASILQDLKDALADDLKGYLGTQNRKLVGLQDASPAELAAVVRERQKELKQQLRELTAAQNTADMAEKAVGEIPAEEQMLGILNELQELSRTVADSELKLADIDRRLSEAESQHEHQRLRLLGAQERFGKDFRDKALESRGLEASIRARQALAIFRERLLASKAQWLSNMISQAFQELLRKRHLVDRVVVDPKTYRVSIKDGNGRELPMERLSAGERQLLAIAVLSALIKERKGRFPVVVDTPLARLDQEHRSLLIRRFFATVSHQVMVLSTDQEVEGASYDAIRPHTTAEYVLRYDDSERRSKMTRVTGEQVLVKEAA